MPIIDKPARKGVLWNKDEGRFVNGAQSPGTVVAESSVARVASLAGWILLALALVVFSGWAFHVHPLTSVVPGLATMKPNTLAAFLLVGAALLRRHSSDSRFYSLGVLAIGAATLVEYLSNHDFGIDQLLFRDPASSVDPGRMSQITSLGISLLGAALLLMRAKSPQARRCSRTLALWAGALGVIALLGYTYDTQALYRVRPYSSVSLQTALAFVIAAVGIQCVNPAEGLVRRIHADSAGGAMLRQLLPSALLVPFLLGLIAWLGHKHLGWETGFAMALVVAATMFCLAAIMLRNATHLEDKDLALRDINRTLEDRVRERTAALATQIRERERLQTVLDTQRAQMIAASKLTSLGEMAGGLAHEINSPLNIIQARASDLQEVAEATQPVEPATVLKATRSILRTAERIMAIVRGLRTFARDGRTDAFEKTPVQVILDDTLALCREKFAVHGITLEVADVDRDLTLECQRVQISQVLLNLLNNAFDAVQMLPVRWVRLGVSREGDSIQISVTDSGRGIPREIADKAMQPFFTTKPVGKGTGLGLSISNAIAESHHGQLSIDSRGPNTRIVLSLPIRHSSSDGDNHEGTRKQDPVAG